jgi:SRSO17 transposase
MTAPTFVNFQIILAGWVFASRRTVTAMILAAGVVGEIHHSILHRFFARARWSLDALGLAVFALVEPWVTDERVLVAIDDTLARKSGQKMFGTGMHYDPLISSRKTTLVNWGHDWVVLGVLVRFRGLPFCEKRCFCLPILFRMYLNKQAAEKARRVYRTRPELAVQMLHVLCESRKNRAFHAIADSAYGGQSVLNHLPGNCDLTSRLTMNARLYNAPPQRKAGQNGRPRKRGDRLPSPEQMLAARVHRRTMRIYGREQEARLSDVEARLHAAPNLPLRVVAIEPLTGGRDKQAFYSTVHDASIEQVLWWYAMRWAIEVTFHDAKQHLGFEQPQGWTRTAAERTAPMAMLLYSLIVLWFAQVGHHHYKPVHRPWYRHKPHASFADMLNTLKRLSIRDQVLQTGLAGPGSRKTLKILDRALQVHT